jgi:hypothetical protein
MTKPKEKSYTKPLQKLHGRMILERENEIIKDIKELEARMIDFEGRITRKVDDLVDEFSEFKSEMIEFKSDVNTKFDHIIKLLENKK